MPKGSRRCNCDFFLYRPGRKRPLADGPRALLFVFAMLASIGLLSIFMPFFLAFIILYFVHFFVPPRLYLINKMNKLHGKMAMTDRAFIIGFRRPLNQVEKEMALEMRSLISIDSGYRKSIIYPEDCVYDYIFYAEPRRSDLIFVDTEEETLYVKKYEIDVGKLKLPYLYEDVTVREFIDDIIANSALAKKT